MLSSCRLNTFHTESRLFLNSHIQRYIFLKSCNLWTLMNLFHSTVTYTCSKYVSNGITILNIFICTAFFFNKDQDGSSLKEALLSGSPGVGKTTTATLVCEELGFTYIEMNASDTRSKKTLEEHISQSLNNETIDGLLTGCQISVRFGMTLTLIKMLHSFSCLTKLTFHCS